MAETVHEAYKKALTEVPPLVSLAGVAAFRVAVAEYNESVDDWSVGDFLSRADQLIEEIILGLYPD